jgi:hypothetical protein
VVQVGEQTDIDFLALAQQLVGGKDAVLFSAEDMAAIRGRLDEIGARVRGREAEIVALLEKAAADVERPPATPEPDADLERTVERLVPSDRQHGQGEV